MKGKHSTQSHNALLTLSLELIYCILSKGIYCWEKLLTTSPGNRSNVDQRSTWSISSNLHTTRQLTRTRMMKVQKWQRETRQTISRYISVTFIFLKTLGSRWMKGKNIS